MWPNGWMDLSPSMEVGLCPGDIVLDGDSAPPPKKRGHSTPNFGPCLLQRNGWMDQHKTSHGGKHRARRRCLHATTATMAQAGHIVSDGDPVPPKGAQRRSGPCLLWPNGRPSQLLLSSCFLVSAIRGVATFSALGGTSNDMGRL